MSERGFDLHPLAAQDITEIWEFIAEDNPAAALRVREDILEARKPERWILRSQPIRKRPSVHVMNCGAGLFMSLHRIAPATPTGTIPDLPH
jgi:hypothetical protein